MVGILGSHQTCLRMLQLALKMSRMICRKSFHLMPSSWDRVLIVIWLL